MDSTLLCESLLHVYSSWNRSAHIWLNTNVHFFTISPCPYPIPRLPVSETVMLIERLGRWVVIHSVPPPLHSASILPPAFLFGCCPEHSCVIAVAQCTECTEVIHRQVHIGTQTHEYLMNPPNPHLTPHMHIHTHAHTRTYIHTILSLTIFSCSHYFPIPLQQKDEVSSQLEVTPVDWANGPEQAAWIPRCHSSYTELSNMRKKTQKPFPWISTSSPLQQSI